MFMSLTYEGVDVAVMCDGYPTVPVEVLVANNTINLADKAIAQVESIKTNYQAAHKAYSEELAFNRTLNHSSADAATRNALQSSNQRLAQLQPELAKWGDIVVKNGGKFNSGTVGNTGSALDANPDFSDKLKKYQKDKEIPTKVLSKAGPEICSGLPPFDVAYAAMLAKAKADNDAKAAPIVAQQNAQYAFVNDLKALTSPNQSALDKGYAERNSPEAKADLLNRGISSGALNGNWDLNTLGLAADLVPKSRSLSNTELNSIAKGIPKGASLEQVKLLLQRAAASGPATRVIASSPVAKGPTSTKPAPKPAAVKTPPAKPAPKPAAPRAQLPKPKGK